MTKLTWGDGSVSVAVYPWDDVPIIVSRISKKVNVPARYIRLRTNLPVLLERVEDWKVHDPPLSIEWDNLWDMWREKPLTRSVVSVVGGEEEDHIAYMRSRWDEVTEKQWADHFQEQFPHLSMQEMLEQIQKQKDADDDQQIMHNKYSKIFKDMSRHTAKDVLWNTKTHRVQYVFQDDRGIDLIFHDMTLSSPWTLAVLHKKVFQWTEKEYFFTKLRRMKDPNIPLLWSEGMILEDIRRAGMGVFIYQGSNDMDKAQLPQAPVIIRQVDKKIVVEMEGNARLEDIQELIQDHDPPKEEHDVGMVGDMVFTDTYLDMPLIQDAIMNDPVLSLFLYVDEARRFSYDNKLPVQLTKYFISLLALPQNADIVFQNVYRQKEHQLIMIVKTPISEQALQKLTIVMSHLVGRFQHLVEELTEEYTKYIPSFADNMNKRKNAMITKMKKPDYITKYPRLFVSSLYRSICQLACQPEMLHPDEIAGIPPERLIRFPPEKVEEIDPEYYFCPSEEYRYAGLKEMKGPKVFLNVAPCCYNSPQTKENERKLENIFTEMVEKGGKGKKDNIIKGKLLIKNPGQLGEVRPPSIRRFLLAYNCTFDYYRIGTRRSSSSLIACMMQHRKLSHSFEDRETDEEVRIRVANDPSCVEACLQENPGLGVEEIRQDMLDMNVYFDPKRFYRAVEIFFGVRLIVFTKPKEESKGEDATLFIPISMRSHYSAHNSSPAVILFEHWGGRTNLVAGFPYPHCELIGFKPKIEEKPELMTDFSDPDVCKTFQKQVFQIVDNIVYDFDGSFPIFPYDRKHCWFDRRIVGQTLDALGKVRWLHFEYNRKLFTALVDPPMAVLKDVPLAPKNTEIPDAVRMRNFLLSFDGWEIDVPDYGSDVVFWSVRQNNVLWKTLEERMPMRLTFVCRLPEARPTQLEARGELLQKVIRVHEPLSLYYGNMFETQISRSSAVHMEKAARIISDLAIHYLSVFLKENEIKKNAVEPDALMDSFYKRHVVVETNHIFPVPYNPSGYVRKDRIIVPSTRFWKKLEFQLRWLLFYHPDRLFGRKDEDTMPNFFSKITDFSLTDTEHYYCHLEHLANVFRYSIEKDYPLVQCTLTELPAMFKQKPGPLMWYHPDFSPLPNPSLVYLFQSFPCCVKAGEEWHTHKKVPSTSELPEEGGDVEQETVPVMEWSHEQHKWEWVVRGNNPVYRARVGDDNYLLFLS